MYGPGELAQARADYAALLPYTGTVKRKVAADNSAGGSTFTASTVETLPAMAWPMRVPIRNMEGQRPITIADFEVHLAHATRTPESFDVLRRDSIFLNGKEFIVTAIDKGKTEALYLAVFCLQVQ